MRCELPIFVRCCFCFPLRYGLLVCFYIKQIVNLLFVSYLIYLLHRRSSSGAEVSGWNLWFTVALLIFTTLDIGFNGLFIIGGHTKNYKKMRIFYRYCIATLCLYAVFLALMVFDCIYFFYRHPRLWYMFVGYVWLPGLSIISTLMIMELYVMILVRSEFLKLKNNAQFEFVNREAEEKCVANIEIQIPESV